MKVVALLNIRNEAAYLDTCLRYLRDGGIQTFIIDNESSDKSVEIAQRWLGKGVLGVETYPFPGYFDLRGMLRRKAQLAQQIDADWFIHHDADEVRQSRRAGETLLQAITRLDAQGYNAIDFDEFVFVPTRTDQSAVGRNYVVEFPQAYYFCPHPFRQVKAWKKTAERVDLASFGGHRVVFPGQRISDEKLILRHYPYLSWQHLEDKYTRERVYNPQEVEGLGWHRNRARFDITRAQVPPERMLIRPDRSGWDTSCPLALHPFLGRKVR